VRSIKDVEFAQGWADGIGELHTAAARHVLTSDFANKTIDIEPALPPIVNDVKDSLDHYNHVQNLPSDQKMSKYKLEYDALVISVGAYSASFGIPGVSEQAPRPLSFSDDRLQSTHTS